MEKWFLSMERPMSEIFPRLEKLVVSPVSPFDERWPNAGKLPSTLTYLDIISTIADFATLPRNLRTFKIQSSSGPNGEIVTSFANPPEHLTSLKTSLLNFPDPNAGELPSTLTELNLTIILHDITFTTVLGALPPDLTSLTLSANLHGPNLDDTTEISFGILESLVHLSINDLSLEFARANPPLTSFAEDAFSHTLASLELRTKLDKGAIVLPLDLKLLNIEFCDWHPETPIYYSTRSHKLRGLPPYLTTLLAPKVTLEEANENAFWLGLRDSHLPGSLTHLSIPSAPFFENIITSLPEDGLNTLVATTWKSLPEGNSILALPAFRALTSLSVIKSAHQFDLSDFLYLPRDMKHLELNFKSSFAQRRAFDTSLFSALPPRLITLDLASANPMFEGLDVKGLSYLGDMKELENLVINVAKIEFQDADLQQLPRSLRQFRLRAPGPTRLTGECFAFLPRYLTDLALPELQKCEDEDLIFLPRTLVTFSVDQLSNLSERCVALVPSTMRVADLKKIIPLTLSRSILASPDPRLDFLNRLAKMIPRFEDPVDYRSSTNSFFSHNNLVSPEVTPSDVKEARRVEARRIQKKHSFYTSSAIVLVLALLISFTLSMYIN
jgi:hypothetical protein